MSEERDWIDEPKKPLYKWERRFSILPRRCIYSGAFIRMFGYSYCKILNTPNFLGHSTNILSWMHPNEYTLRKLKGTLGESGG